jgi:hypothetical protein
MSKRKRASLGKTPQGGGQPADDAAASSEEAAVKEDMVHVSPDVLAGSPDIFASNSTPKNAAPDVPDVVTEPVTEEPPVETVPAAAAAIEPESPPVTPTEPVLAPVPSISTPPTPPYVTAVPHPPRASRGGSSAALGIVLVVVGLFALGVVLFGIDLTQYGWPLFVIIPGLTLLVVGFLGGGAGASVPGGIVTMLGLVLAYQSSSGDWPSWAFTWALVVPFGVGLGLYLQALRDRDTVMLRRGRTLMFAGAMIFLIGFVLFESILGISGQDYGVFGKAALPGLLIIIGIVLLVRSMQRSRKAP